MQNASVALQSPEHEVLKHVLVLQSVTSNVVIGGVHGESANPVAGTLVLSFERQGSTFVGTHTVLDDSETARVLSRISLVTQDWYEFSAS